jgi:hypothetical protein
MWLAALLLAANPGSVEAPAPTGEAVSATPASPAVPAQVGPRRTAPAPPVKPGIPVQVRRVNEDGSMAPVSGVEVLLERWASSPATMGEKRLDALYQSTSDAAGYARFPVEARAGGAALIASTVDEGITRFASPAAGNSAAPIDLRLYELGGVAEDLQGAMQVDLSVRDGFVIVETAWTVSTLGRRLVRLEGEDRLRVPIALPAVFGDSMDTGMFPNDTARRHLALQLSPETGRLIVKDGAVFYEGAIAPGAGTSIRVRYPLPIVAERMDLAFRSPIKTSSLSLSSAWSDRVAPRVVPETEFRAYRSVRSENVRRFLVVKQPPKAGDALVIHVSRLPRPLDVHATAAIGGSLVLLFLFSLALVSGWRREH